MRPDIRSLCLSIAAVAAWAGAARADGPSLPVYDVATVCGGGIVAQRYATERGCVIDQYYTRHISADQWLDVLPAVRDECIAANKWSDYSVLQMCLAGHSNDKEVSSPTPASTPGRMPDGAGSPQK